MDTLLLLIPISLSLGNFILSSYLFTKLTSRIQLLEEKLSSTAIPSYPPPPPPLPSAHYYNVQQGYGYTYSGGQGNLNVV
jgi:hypothetical protein